MAIEPSINMRYFLENRLGARVLIVSIARLCLKAMTRPSSKRLQVANLKPWPSRVIVDLPN